MKRFGAMLDESGLTGTGVAGGITTEEMEAKRKARMERFGANEVQES